MPLVDDMCRSTIDLDFEVPTPSPSAISFDTAGIPPQASTPLQSFTRAPRRSSFFLDRRTDRQNPLPAPSEVSSPFSVFLAVRSYLTRRFPNHRLRCALRVSHPLDALLPARPAGPISSRSRSWGSLLEALFRARRRTSSPTPGPSWGSLPAPKSWLAPPGVQHIARSPTTIPGV